VKALLQHFEHCPACDASSTNAERLFDGEIMNHSCAILKCPVCGLIYKEFVPSHEAIDEIYTEDYVHFHPSETTLAEINSAKQKLARCRKLLGVTSSKKPLRLLDVGCGSGNFVNIARRLGYDAEGIDPYLPNGLQDESLSRKSPDEISPASYDIATLLNIAEHLERPREMFDALRRLLKPGGVLLLTCPYGDSWAFRVHQAQWTHLMLDEHLLFWTPNSLTRMLRQIGFRGAVSYRIAGSPFPYGRVKPSAVTSTPAETQNQFARNNDENGKSLQKRVWALGRAVQRRETTANIVRSIVHLTRSGDYLEYAIGVGE